MPKVSVVIPCYNAADYVGTAIESVLAQTFADLEIICVDNASTDDTPRVLARYADKAELLHEPRPGPGFARNKGIASARGPLVAFLDADDYWEPDKLRLQVEVMDAQPEIGLVSADYWVRDDRVAGAPTRGPVSCTRMDCLTALFWACYLHTSTVMARTAVLRELNGFDGKLLMSDDYDLWLRVAESYALANVPQPLSTYRLHSDSLSLRTFEETAECTDAVISSFCQRNPRFAPFERRRKALERLRLARMLLTRDRALSGRFYRSAVAMWPFLPKAYLGAVACALPMPWAALRRLRNLIRTVRGGKA